MDDLSVFGVTARDRDLARRTFLRLSALAAGGSVLSGASRAAPSDSPDRWVRTPGWAGFRSVLRTGDGVLLTGIRTNVEDEQVGWAVKLDADHDVVWNRTYQSPPHLQETDSGEDHDGLEFAVPDGDGGYLLVGWWHTMGSDSRRAWLTRVSSSGIPRWSRIYRRDDVNSFRDDFADGIRVNDGYVLVGRTIAGEFLDEETGDGWIVKIRNDGRIAWQRAYDPNGTSTDWSRDVTHTEFSSIARAENGYLVVGETSPRGDEAEDSTNTAAWVVRTDSTGAVRWRRTYRIDSDARNEFRDVAAASDGFYVAGVTGRETYVRERHDYVMSGRCWAAKLDTRGRLSWQDVTDGGGFHAVTPSADGAVFVGSREGRAHVLAYDDDGDQIGAHRSSIRESVYGDVVTTDDEYLFVGHGREDASVNGLFRTVSDGDLRNSEGDGDRSHLLEIVAHEMGDVRYRFTVDGTVEGVRLDERVKAEDNDVITRHDDGTVTVEGFTGNTGYGDAFRFTGEVRSFERTDGNAAFDVRINGTEVDPDDVDSWSGQ